MSWNSTTGWVDALLVSNQITVDHNTLKIALKDYGNYCEFFYVGINNKIEKIYDNGLYAGEGISPISLFQTEDVLNNSQIVVTDNSVYFIGADNKIYDIVWNGTNYTGGNLPLVGGADLVRTGTNITNDANNDPNHLYFVNPNYKICDMYLDASGIWQWNLLDNSPFYKVQDYTNMICYDGKIFYANAVASGKLSWLYHEYPTGTIINEALNNTSGFIHSGTQFYIWANDIFEEGSTTNTFKSYHIFYHEMNNYRLKMLVYDDAICPFVTNSIEPPAFLDPCDLNGDGNGWEDPNNNFFLTGYNCAACKVRTSDGRGDFFPKTWHAGKIPVNNVGGAPIYSGGKNITSYKKHFFYVGHDNKIYDFTRTPLNGLAKTVNGNVYTQPDWQDEFNGTVLNDQTPPLNNGTSGHDWYDIEDVPMSPAVCCNQYYDDPLNVTEGGGNLTISSYNTACGMSPTTLPHRVIENCWVSPPIDPLCLINFWANNGWQYDGNLLLKVDNDNTVLHNPCQFSSGAISTKRHSELDQGEGPKFSIDPTHSEIYMESRFQIPRGKYLWPAFWLYYQGTEDINVEFTGNGKVFICTEYDSHGNYSTFGQPVATYAIGYRFYDDYYTYAIDWSLTDVKYYLNNENIGSFPNWPDPSLPGSTAPHCVDPHELFFTNGIVDNSSAQCEAEIFPAYYNIDYVRSWGGNITHSPIPMAYGKPNNIANKEFTVYPNPTTDKLIIKGGGLNKSEIFNVQGEKILESNSNTINVEKLAKGIYFITIIDTDGDRHYSKFVKE